MTTNCSPLTFEQLERISSSLMNAMHQCEETDQLTPLTEGIVHACEQVGIHPDRLQLPFFRIAGLRHPLYVAMVMTWWRDREPKMLYRYHGDWSEEETKKRFRQTPYGALVYDDAEFIRTDLTQPDLPFPLQATLAEEGFQDYIAIRIPLPDGRMQPITMAARRPFPEDAHLRLMAFRPILGISIYGAYAANTSRRLASTYIGPNSGRSVLAGDFYRGQTNAQQAGIVFCDLRGFTSMTANIGAAQTVEILNTVFEVTGEAITAHNGEILKFIGDAMLAIFPVTDQRTVEDVARDVVSSTTLAIENMAKVTSSVPLKMGFGGHIGTVQIGNIGTKERLDFTVIGDAVNLASRLESLCVKMKQPAIFSAEIARHIPAVRSLGKQSVKGIAEPVSIYTLPQP